MDLAILTFMPTHDPKYSNKSVIFEVSLEILFIWKTEYKNLSEQSSLTVNNIECISYCRQGNNS